MADQNLQKFESKNPVQRWLIRKFRDELARLIFRTEHIRTICDVGCGEGFMIRHLLELTSRIQFTGVDTDKNALDFAQQKDAKTEYVHADILRLPFPDNSFDCIVCTEVLEHVPNYNQALSELFRISSGTIIVSVPHEPWFRLMNLLRGRNIFSFGNYPFHVHTWSLHAFKKVVQLHGDIQEISTPFPWTIIKLIKR